MPYFLDTAERKDAEPGPPLQSPASSKDIEQVMNKREEHQQRDAPRILYRKEHNFYLIQK